MAERERNTDRQWQKERNTDRQWQREETDRQ